MARGHFERTSFFVAGIFRQMCPRHGRKSRRS
jgi:hypothetical protein